MHHEIFGQAGVIGIPAGVARSEAMPPEKDHRSDTYRRTPTPFTAEELREIIVSDEELLEDPDGARAAEEIIWFDAERKANRPSVSTRAEALARGEGLSSSKPAAKERDHEPER